MRAPALAPRGLCRAEDGVAAIEFGLIAPTLVLLLLGIMDVGYTLYSNTILDGAIQQAARDSSIEGATPSELDGHVAAMVHGIVPRAALAFDRKAYANFSDVSRAEDFTDTNSDGTCNAGEPFEDVNGNHTWDSDRGNTGQGGARDAVLYTVTVTYARPFPFARMVGLPDLVTTQARTVLRNQPYGMQHTTVTVENCA